MLKNKFTLALFAMLAMRSALAITIEPVQIQSAPGELLYAEIKFKNLAPHQRLDVSLANPEDLIALGISHQPPGHLNFYTRRNSQGEGVITITSSRPMTQTELDVVIKIQAGDSSRLQHIRKSIVRNQSLMAQQQDNSASQEKTLQPMMIVSEKEIALNLPTATQYSQATHKSEVTENLLNARQALPPSLDHASVTANLVNTSSSTAQAATQPHGDAIIAQLETETSNDQADSVSTNASGHSAAIPMQSTLPQDPTVQSSAITDTEQPASAQAENLSASSATYSQAAETAQHVVQSNESLWKIADRIAKQQNRSIKEVMQQIKQDNAHAFVKGDINRLKRGVTLNLNASNPAKNVDQQKQQIAEFAKNIPSTQSGKAKYRLQQAEMSLVAEQEQDSSNASAIKSTKTNKTSKELSLKVMTAREKTVKLQRNVTQLELSLGQKDHRIQLLNARLAQLQQQLKAQTANKKSNL